MRSVGSGAGPRILWAAYAQRGSVYPIVPVIAALKATGAEIQMLGLEELRRIAELLDINFRPYHTDIWYDWSRADGSDRHGFGPAADPDWFNARVAAEFAEVQSAVESFAPDVLLTDSFVTGAGLAAESVKLTWVSYVHYLFDEGAEVDAMHRIWWEREGLAEPEAYSQWWNSVRSVVGLPREMRPAREAPWYRMSPHRTLLLGHPHLRRGNRPQPEYVTRTSIPPWDEPLPIPQRLTDDSTARTRILVSNSATWQDDMRLVTAAFEGLANIDVDLHATIAADHPVPCDIPDNVTTHRYTQHSIIVPQVDMVICSGGYGLVSKALWNGRPVVACPGRADQPYVTEALVRAGCGVSITRPPEPAAIAAAVTHILASPTFSEHASVLAGPQPGFPGPEACAEMINDLAMRSSPANTTSSRRFLHP